MHLSLSRKKCYMLTILNRMKGRKEWNSLSQHRTPQEYLRSNEGLITAVAVGGFFILVGAMFVLTPDLWQKIVSFFKDITTRTFPFGAPNSVIALPAPATPGGHATLYNSFMQFSVGMGVLQIVILALRLLQHSKVGKVAETVGNMVFWFGTAPLVSFFLLQGTVSSWFQYWGALIVVIGISVVARAAVYIIRR
jgi:hypothetical protein